MFWRSDSALGHVFTDGDEIVVGTLPFGLEGGLVPARAELAAAANVRHRVRAATLEPKFADRRRVAGLEGDFKSAVAVEDRRCAAVRLEALAVDHKVRHRRPVGALCHVLVHLEFAGIEPRRE